MTRHTKTKWYTEWIVPLPRLDSMRPPQPPAPCVVVMWLPWPCLRPLLVCSWLTSRVTFAPPQAHHKCRMPAAAAQLPHGWALLPADILQLWVLTRGMTAGKWLSSLCWFLVNSHMTNYSITVLPEKTDNSFRLDHLRIFTLDFVI